MSRYETEEEQIEAAKQWWKKNGTQVLTSILIVVVVVAGWRYWTNSQYVASANASATFEMLQSYEQNNQFGEVATEALKLMSDEPKSPYAASAAMLHAAYSFNKGDVDQAIANLEWVLANSADQAIKVTAHTRLARIYIDQSNFDQAQAELNAAAALNLNAVEKANVAYIKGLLALKKADKQGAIDAFTEVTENAQADQNLLGLAKIQLDDLAQ